ncbi:MAG: SMI1/KNR4 family protein [Verrucomicrobiota bacterium]
MSVRLWKPHIISLTEHPQARARKCDASFFPPVAEQAILQLEKEGAFQIPSQLRSFIGQSDGLEARRGEIWPVLPTGQWSGLPTDSAGKEATDFVGFGETDRGSYLFSVSQSEVIFQRTTPEAEVVPFAQDFCEYLNKIFHDEE